MQHGSIAPGLLIAMPNLVDENFERAVVLMVEHGETGSFGLIVNQPSPIPVGEILAHLDIEWRGDPEAVAWSGGPVMPGSAWMLHEPLEDLVLGEEDERSAGMVQVGEGLVLSSSPTVLAHLAAAPPRRFRFVMGYSGWGPAQLGSELAQSSWLHALATPELIFETPPDEMWEAAIRSLGIGPEVLVAARGIH